MKCLLAFYALNIVVLVKVALADRHTYGSYLGGNQILHKKVIGDTNKVPKNYTIIFKYLGSEHRQFSYFIIDVDTNSTGKVDVTNNMKDIEANVSVYNAINVTATISLFSFGSITKVKKWPFTSDEYSVRSYTIVHKKNASPGTKPFYRNAIGLRQSGDRLLYFESRNITNASRFPSRAFEYSSNHSITYVGFSFNSPTAMAMVNTTFISDNEFSTVAYDMNTEHFIANMSIYGYRRGREPSTYFNMLGEGEE